MTRERRIKLAIAYLERHGYFTQNMWHVDDVKLHVECTDAQAHDILLSALTNEVLVERIFELIISESESENLKIKN